LEHQRRAPVGTIQAFKRLNCLWDGLVGLDHPPEQSQLAILLYRRWDLGFFGFWIVLFLGREVGIDWLGEI